jgi:hypothetical protein
LCQRPVIAIPNGSVERATYGAEAERVDLDTQGGHVLLLEFTGQVALDEGGLQSDNVSMGRTCSSRCTLATPQSAQQSRDSERRERRELRAYLAGTTIANKDQLEGRDLGCLSHVVWMC